MTVHRAQGSQFDSVSFVVPPPESPLLTRELLYTAVTRARRPVHGPRGVRVRRPDGSGRTSGEPGQRTRTASPPAGASGARCRAGSSATHDAHRLDPRERVGRDQSGASPSHQAWIIRAAIELRPGSPSSPASSFALSSSRVYHSA